VLALTGERADQFRRVLDEFDNTTGKVDQSLQKLLANPFKQFQVFLNDLRIQLQEVGRVFITAFVDQIDRFGGREKVIERFTVALEGLKPVAEGVATAFGTVVQTLGNFITRQGGLENAGAVFQCLRASAKLLQTRPILAFRRLPIL
jgi:hypothetical protein